MDRADALQQRADAGEPLPLLGLAFSVKDNIHVAGMATTSNCPALAIMPAETAPAVRALEEAGAVLIGKNTMDQFATGLNGTRSPEPLCRNAIDPAYIPGGSSSGSAVAVARDIVSFSLGSDTGGSGRVPAACNGIVGLKPTIGLVSTRGVLYNSRIFDCIPVFTRYCADAYDILEPLRLRRTRPIQPGRCGSHRPCCQAADCANAGGAAAPGSQVLRRRAFGTRLRTQSRPADQSGIPPTEIDFGPFEAAGRLVFQSAMVAERLCDYGDVISDNPAAIDPSVRTAIEAGRVHTAKDAFEAYYEMKRLQRAAAIALHGFAALIVPTVPLSTR